MASLGETDAESVIVLEKELAAWLAARSGGRSADPQRPDIVASIFAASDANTQRRLVANLRARKVALADKLAPPTPVQDKRVERSIQYSGQAAACARKIVGADQGISLLRAPRRAEPRKIPVPPPRLNFDDLIQLDSHTFASLLQELDMDVLGLALTGSSDALIDRVCNQLPKRAARSLRRQLRQLGPTRLSDVEAAQRAVASAAARRMATARAPLAA
jgi:flagellar motor switch protein FliG